LSGPAIFVFKNVNSGKQWTVAVNAIALLDEDFWDKHQVADAAKLEPGALVEKLTGFGVASISLSEAKRARWSTVKSRKMPLSARREETGACNSEMPSSICGAPRNEPVGHGRFGRPS
jgi:hypothetical protein